MTDNVRGNPSASATASEIRARILKKTGLTASAGVPYNKFTHRTSALQMRPDEGEISWTEAVLGGPSLVPIGIEQRRLADLVEPGALLGGELHVDGGEIVLELLLGASADDQRSDGGPPQQPGERNARSRNAMRLASKTALRCSRFWRRPSGFSGLT